MPSKSLSSLLQTTICTQCRNWATLRLVRPQPGDAAQGTEEILRKNVYFYPEIAGKPVYGTFRICISVSGSGEIVGVDKFANEYTLVDVDVEGKNYREVATSLSKKEYTLNAEVAPDSILVDSVSDAFYADPESEYTCPFMY